MCMSGHIKGGKMKPIRLCVVALGLAAYGISAHAACTAETKTYTSCKPGYYLENGACLECPSSGGTAGQSADKNDTGITACYIPSGSTFSDTTGSGTYTGNCYYVK